jgi:hypothetical protein
VVQNAENGAGVEWASVFQGSSDLCPAVNADIPNSSVRKSGVLKIIEVLEGRWAMLVR